MKHGYRKDFKHIPDDGIGGTTQCNFVDPEREASFQERTNGFDSPASRSCQNLEIVWMINYIKSVSHRNNVKYTNENKVVKIYST